MLNRILRRSKKVPEPDELVILAEGLTKEFDDEVAVADVTFQIKRGQIFGFIGPSGSGKTTTVRLLTGYYPPSGGRSRVLGISPTDFTQSTREKIGYMPQLFVLYPTLTIWENLNFSASLYGMGLMSRRKRLHKMLDFVELSDHKNKLARDISGGMQRRLSLAATLLHDPALLFLDEPTAGIDPVLRRKFWDHFKALQDEGRTIFVTTQYVGEAAYCDFVGVMAQGRLLMVDTPDGLRKRAFGGEVVDIVLKERVTHERHLVPLRMLPFIQGKVERSGSNQVRLIVDEASTAMPALIDWSKDNEVEIESIEEFLPPFDDVFVELVKKEPARG